MIKLKKNDQKKSATIPKSLWMQICLKIEELVCGKKLKDIALGRTREIWSLMCIQVKAIIMWSETLI